MAFRYSFIGEGALDEVRRDAEFARLHGFSALEYNYHPRQWNPTHPSFPQLTEEHVREMRRILDDQGIGVSMLGLWGWNHIAEDEAERREAHETLRRAIDYAGLLGASVFASGGGENKGAALEAQFARFMDFYPAMLDRIVAGGLRPAIYAMHARSFFGSVQAFEMLWERLPQVGLKFDPANWLHAGHDYLAVLRFHGRRVAHVHVKEHLYHEGDLAAQPPAGMGDIAWGKVMAFLYEADYDGYLSFEPHGNPWSTGVRRRQMLLLSKRHLGQFILG